MIEEGFIKKISEQLQSTEQNVVREYCQHLFLSSFYKQKGTERFLFKGGTALRLIWDSPRFSEDLDFSAFKIRFPEIEDLLEQTLVLLEQGGLSVNLIESKRTSGGYLGILEFRWNRFRAQIQLEVSLRQGRSPRAVVTSIASSYVTDYTLVHLDEPSLVAEKVQALLTRGKPRDFYDLYFILRKRMAFSEVFARDKELKKKILYQLERFKGDLRAELKEFLPASHQGLLKNFKENLAREIERNLP